MLDTGIQLDHPDLAGAIWTNPGEVAGNGRDDDNDGIVDDVHGANMFDMSANVSDDNDHGTHVSGIIAARRGNGIGGSGIAPEATILPVKVLDANMGGDTLALARGIRYAVDRGAKILSISINTDATANDVKSAVVYAGQRGAVIVAAAGNDGRNIDLLPRYLASLSDPAIIGVGATMSNGHLWASSNTGTLSVDLAAPGAGIVSTGARLVVPVALGHLGRDAVRRRHDGAARGGSARPLDERAALDRPGVDGARRPAADAARRRPPRCRRGDAQGARRHAVEAPRRAPAPAAAPALRLRAKSKVRAGTRMTRALDRDRRRRR